MANVLGVTGGFLVGWPIGTAISGGEPNWAMAGVGAGILVLSIPVIQKFNKQAQQAVDTYNGETDATSFWDRNELHFSIRGNGIGMALSF